MAAITENVQTEKYIDVAKDVHEICVSDSEKTIGDGTKKISITSTKTESELKPESEVDMKKLVAMFKKLNPLAKEFFPSYYNTKKNNHTGKDNQILSADVAKKNKSSEEFDHDLKKDDNNRKV